MRDLYKGQNAEVKLSLVKSIFLCWIFVTWSCRRLVFRQSGTRI